MFPYKQTLHKSNLKVFIESLPGFVRLGSLVLNGASTLLRISFKTFWKNEQKLFVYTSIKSGHLVVSINNKVIVIISETAWYSGLHHWISEVLMISDIYLICLCTVKQIIKIIQESRLDEKTFLPRCRLNDQATLWFMALLNVVKVSIKSCDGSSHV